MRRESDHAQPRLEPRLVRYRDPTGVLHPGSRAPTPARRVAGARRARVDTLTGSTTAARPPRRSPATTSPAPPPPPSGGRAHRRRVSPRAGRDRRAPPPRPAVARASAPGVTPRAGSPRSALSRRGLRCRVRLADGRVFRGALPAARHRALQLGMLHAQTVGLVELTAGTRSPDGRLRSTPAPRRALPARRRQRPARLA